MEADQPRGKAMLDTELAIVLIAALTLLALMLVVRTARAGGSADHRVGPGSANPLWLHSPWV